MMNRTITAADIITGLGGNPREHKACCPAHDDHNPSLSVKDGRNGKPVVHCHAGCSQEEVIAELKARDLWPNGSNDNDRKRQPQQEEYDAHDSFRTAMHILRSCAKSDPPAKYLKGRGLSLVPQNARILASDIAFRTTGYKYPVMVFPITNERHLLQGASLTFLTADASENLTGAKGRVRRFFGDAKGGFVRLGNIQIDPNKPLLIGEGIETVLSAMQIAGLPSGIAALSAGNFDNIHPPPAVEYIIVGDDDKSGRKASAALAERLAVPGRTVRVASPTKHNDWNDTLRDPDVDLEAEKRAILQAPKQNTTALIRPLSMRELIDRKFPERHYLVRPWMKEGGLCMIDAMPGHGKTYLAMSVAYAVASGQPMIPIWPVEQTGRVLYVDGELPGEDLQQRVRLLGPILPEEQFRVLGYAQYSERLQPMLDLGVQEDLDKLDDMIEQHKSDLIILDSITTLVTSGVENDVDSWRIVQKWSLKHRGRGRTVVFLHHHGRSGMPRGTSSREVTLDTRLTMKEDRDQSTATHTAFHLDFSKTRGFFGKDKEPLS